MKFPTLEIKNFHIFELFFKDLFYVYGYFACMCVYAPHTSSTYRDQKRVSDSPEKSYRQL